MGQVYRFDPRTGCSTYQEPSAAQLKVLHQIAAAGILHVNYIGGRTPFAAVIGHEWAIEVGENDLKLTAKGRRELRHQKVRAALAATLGVPNSPRLAKFL